MIHGLRKCWYWLRGDRAGMAHLELLRAARGLPVHIVRSGLIHFQIRSRHITVNYSPLSKNRTASIEDVRHSARTATPQEAVQMALVPPPLIPGAPIRQLIWWENRPVRQMKLAKHPRCHWCGVGLTECTATLDHLIPLKRGGTNHVRNIVLACEPCNKARGHDMPEMASDAWVPDRPQLN